MAAASGSAQMLNSAAGVTLPREAEPPMITKSRTQVASRGSRRSASPMLVSGPVATSVISPGAAAMVSMMKSIACPLSAVRRGAGSTAPPSPDSPCTCPACSAGRSSGAAHPGVTGTSARPDERRHGERVRGGLGQRDVAGHGGDAGQLDLGRAGREGDRERVVDAGVAVEDDGGAHAAILSDADCAATTPTAPNASRLATAENRFVALPAG